MLLVLTDPVAALRLGHSDVERHGGDVGRFVFVRNRVLQNVKYYEGGHCLQDNKTIEGGQGCRQGTVRVLAYPRMLRRGWILIPEPAIAARQIERQHGRPDERPHEQRCGDCEEQVPVSGHRSR